MTVTPYEIERRFYLDQLGIEDDPSITIGDLKNLTGGAANVYRSAVSGSGGGSVTPVTDGEVAEFINQPGSTTRSSIEQMLPGDTEIADFIDTESPDSLTRTAIKNIVADMPSADDPTVAGFLGDTGSQSHEALKSAIPEIDSRDYVQPSSSINTVPGIVAALNAGVVSGKPVKFRAGIYRVTTQFEIPEGSVVDCEPGTVWHVATSIRAITGNSNVTIKGLTLRGTLGQGAAATNSSQGGISFAGASGTDRKTNIRILDCVFENFGWRPLGISKCSHFWVQRCVFRNNGYMAISIGNSSYGHVEDNYVYGTGVYPSWTTSCYGISVSTDPGGFDPVTNPIPEYIVLARNTFENQSWKGLDTHGGRHIVIADNLFKGCQQGLGVTIKVGEDGSSPQYIVVSGNIVNGQGYPGEVAGGMSFNGSPNSETARVVVTNNVVSHHGSSMAHEPVGTRSGGMSFTYIQAAVVANNYYYRCLGNCVSFHYSASTVISGNVFHSYWRETADTRRTSNAIYLNDAVNAIVTGNAIATGFGGADEGAEPPNKCERSIHREGGGGTVQDNGNEWRNSPYGGLAKWEAVRQDSVDIGGMRFQSNTNLTHFNASAVPNDLPYGVSNRRVTTGVGFPEAGLLVSYIYPNHCVQVVYATLTNNVHTRMTTDNAGPWSAWKQW